MKTQLIFSTFSDIYLSISNTLSKITDIAIHESLLEFSEIYFSDKLKSFKASTIETHLGGLEILSNILENTNFPELGWNFLCDVMHNKDLLNYLFNVNNYSKYLLTSISNASKQTFKLYILYLINSEKYNSFNISELRKSPSIIKKSTETTSKPYLSADNRELFETMILTSYPLNSEIKSIYQVHDKDNKKSYNINLNTKNDFLIVLLKNFINILAINPRITSSYRVFYFYFEKSFGNLNTPLNIEDFTYETFSEQLNYYGNLPNKIHFNGLLKSDSKTAAAVVPPQRILIQFYIYLLEYIALSNSPHRIFKDSWITLDVLKSPFFIRKVCDGFIFTYYNALDTVPIYDKWWLNAGEDSKASIAITKSNTCIDFSKIKDNLLRQRLKEWVWYGYGNSNIIRRKNGCSAIIDFLIFKEKYDERLSKIDFLFTTKTDFSSEMFFQYRFYAKNKYKNPKSLGEHFVDIRSFLNSIKPDFNINPKCFKYISLKKDQWDINYGCPLTKEDFHLILNEFKGLETQLEYGVLLTNIFYLCSTTNLRPGEVLSLQRDCIIYKDDNGNGTIKLLRKTSKGTYVHQELDAETINLIESSILLTNEWSTHMQKDEDKNFIFISKTTSTSFGNNYQKLNSVFINNFRNIVLKLEGQLSNYYSPYNLRDTFINIVYDNFSKYNEKDIDTLERITANSYAVVIKNYRRRFAVREYVEAISKVIISNVDINGNIFQDESSMKDNLPVNNDLGCCKNSECTSTSLLEYDIENRCLICNNFITSLSRIPYFEKKILDLRYKLDNLNCDDLFYKSQQKLILTDIKLCGTYLTKMLELKKSL